MLLIFPLEVVQVCEIGAFFVAGLMGFFILLKAFFVVDKAFLSNLFEFLQLSFGLSIIFGTVNDKCSFCLMIFNSRADIITRCNFNQVRCFSLHLV